MNRRGLLAIAFFALVPVSGRASDLPMDRATLHGLEALSVVVDIPPDLEQAGIARTTLLARIRQGLLKAAVPVTGDAKDFVGLRVTVAHEKRTAFAMCVSLGIYQNVSLVRDSKIRTTTETWSGESVVLVPPKLLDSALSSTIDELLAQLVTAFRAGNP